MQNDFDITQLHKMWSTHKEFNISTVPTVDELKTISSIQKFNNARVARSKDISHDIIYDPAQNTILYNTTNLILTNYDYIIHVPIISDKNAIYDKTREIINCLCPQIFEYLINENQIVSTKFKIMINHTYNQNEEFLHYDKVSKLLSQLVDSDQFALIQLIDLIQMFYFPGQSEIEHSISTKYERNVTWTHSIFDIIREYDVSSKNFNNLITYLMDNQHNIINNAVDGNLKFFENGVILSSDIKRKAYNHPELVFLLNLKSQCKERNIKLIESLREKEN